MSYETKGWEGDEKDEQSILKFALQGGKNYDRIDEGSFHHDFFYDNKIGETRGLDTNVIAMNLYNAYIGALIKEVSVNNKDSESELNNRILEQIKKEDSPFIKDPNNPKLKEFTEDIVRRGNAYWILGTKPIMYSNYMDIYNDVSDDIKEEIANNELILGKSSGNKVRDITGDNTIDKNDEYTINTKINGWIVGDHIKIGDIVTFTVNGKDYETVIVPPQFKDVPYNKYFIDIPTNDLIAGNGEMKIEVSSMDLAGNTYLYNNWFCK